MGKTSFWKRVNNKPDGRKLRAEDVRRKPQTLLIEQFFHEAYWSAGETLPEFPVQIENVDQVIQADGPPGDEELVLPDWSPETCAADLAARAVSDPGETTLCSFRLVVAICELAPQSDSCGQRAGNHKLSVSHNVLACLEGSLVQGLAVSEGQPALTVQGVLPIVF